MLIRALLPEHGLDAMRTRRGVDADRALCSGPGKLCQALAITREQDGLPLDEAAVRASAAPRDSARSRPGLESGSRAPRSFRGGTASQGSPFLSRPLGGKR